jgi:hypothetical protein
MEPFEVVEHQLQVAGADGDVGVAVVELVGREAFQADLAWPSSARWRA